MTTTAPPWYPDVLVADGRILRVDTLATWYRDFDQSISDWKMTRYYVDARDVQPSEDPRHPSNLLLPRHGRLRELVLRTPIFAVTAPESERLRARGARIYAVGFARNSDDGFMVTACGPDVDRRVEGPFALLACGLGARDRDREGQIERLLRAVTDDRVTRRSIDLAELWSGLAGADSLFSFSFSSSESAQFLDVREAALEEVFRRAEAMADPQSLVDLLAAAMASEQSAIDLPGLGRATLETLPSARVESENHLTIVIDGERILDVPRVTQWVLDEAPEPWLPRADEEWRAGAFARLKALTDQRAAAQRRATRRALLLVMTVFLLGVGGCLYATRKPAYGAPCERNDACRSGLCRAGGSDKHCVAPCGRECWKGTSCTYDAALQTRVCVRE